MKHSLLQGWFFFGQLLGFILSVQIEPRSCDLKINAGHALASLPIK